ncbi:glycoside hydrolase family 6 protein [Microbacterium sp. NPDC077644]|uniref:glycoside hydrolase family 6 protein n=1 Tax=Microbacterium sp. NPDC077644 TaxID=3155055 RepID=UPI00344DFF61
MARTSRRRTGPPRRASWLVVAGAAVLAIVIGLVFAVASAQRWFHTVTAQPPGVGTVVLAPAESKASLALGTTLDAAATAATEYLAAQPTAYWLTPEQDPPGTAGETTAHLLAQARDQDVALALVVYGLPGRDCGNHSAGGLEPDSYRGWVDEIAAALATAPDLQKIVILEPDSLALAPECGNLDERTGQLRGAVESLDGPGTWIYLDGGHSGWLPAEEMARLIGAVGANDRIRGFATNVSNYRSTFDEFDYARAVSEELGGLHAIVDTSRNGAATAGDEWCNPPGQRVGEPGGTYGDDVVDTNLWIKPPGESDGPCNGGPAAGTFWPEGAIALAKSP